MLQLIVFLFVGSFLDLAEMLENNFALVMLLHQDHVQLTCHGVLHKFSDVIWQDRPNHTLRGPTWGK